MTAIKEDTDLETETINENIDFEIANIIKRLKISNDGKRILKIIDDFSEKRHLPKSEG